TGVAGGGSWTKYSRTADARNNTRISAQQPANITGSSRSRDHLATSAPNTADTTPPASTSEIAFERNAWSAISAAAKRYCWVAPRLAPSRKVPKQNHSKLLRKIAQVAITAPTPPIAVPSQKP